MRCDFTPRVSGAVLAALVFCVASRTLADERRDPRRIEISVTDRGFEPRRVTVLQHEQVTLVFIKRTEKGCGREVAVHLDRRDPGKLIEIRLELNKPSALTLDFPVRGRHAFACSDRSKTGDIIVE